MVISKPVVIAKMGIVCDASAPPEHATIGDCTATVPAERSCQPLCDTYFRPTNYSYCDIEGALIPASCIEEIYTMQGSLRLFGLNCSEILNGSAAMAVRAGLITGSIAQHVKAHGMDSTFSVDQCTDSPEASFSSDIGYRVVMPALRSFEILGDVAAAWTKHIASSEAPEGFFQTMQRVIVCNSTVGMKREASGFEMLDRPCPQGSTSSTLARPTPWHTQHLSTPF